MNGFAPSDNDWRTPVEVFEAAGKGGTDKGDPTRLIGRLRSGEPLSELEREALAMTLEGALPPKKKRGRPRKRSKDRGPTWLAAKLHSEIEIARLSAQDTAERKGRKPRAARGWADELRLDVARHYRLPIDDLEDADRDELRKERALRFLKRPLSFEGPAQDARALVSKMFAVWAAPEQPKVWFKVGRYDHGTKSITKMSALKSD